MGGEIPQDRIQHRPAALWVFRLIQTAVQVLTSSRKALEIHGLVQEVECAGLESR